MSTIIAFKAGRLQRRENTNWVDPLPTKGQLQLLVADDGLLHFQWLNRSNSVVEEDLIIFPSEASFEQVTQAAGGRVFVLKFRSSNQRHFYWMQDASPAKDNQYADNVHQLLEDPTYAPSWDEEEPETQPQASTSTAQPQLQLTQAQMDEIRNVLGQMRSRDTGAAAAPSVVISDILTPENLAPVFSNRDLVQSIFPSLPSDLPVPPSAESLQRVIESPQFQSAVRSLDQALATGLLGGLVRSLGLPEEAGTGIEAFLRAIKEQAEKDRDNNTMET
ncbi:hypothetical protein M422DRAFT_25317, partial [Sphaerobolus stellatus SS14]